MMILCTWGEGGGGGKVKYIVKRITFDKRL